MQRLSDRLETLRAADADVASIKAHSDDPDGSILSMLLKWRQQRLWAIEMEMQRQTSLAEDLRVHADADEL